MTFAELVNHGKKFVTDNAPTILATVGAVGVVGTAYLTGKATFEAAKLIENQNKFLAKPGLPPMDAKAKAKLCWRLYLPAAGVGVLTIAAIIGSNKIGTNRAAGLAAAYSLSERGFKEYKEHVKEKFGENKEREVRDELAQKQVNQNPPSPELIVLPQGRVLCKESWTGRYFHSTMEALKGAQNDINASALAGEFPSLTDFYHKVNSSQLRPTQASDAVGWNEQNRLELMFSATLAEPVEGGGLVPVMVISFAEEPKPNFWKPSAY